MATRCNQGDEGGRGGRCVVEIEDADFTTRLRDSTDRFSSDFGGPAVAVSEMPSSTDRCAYRRTSTVNFDKC